MATSCYLNANGGGKLVNQTTV